MPADDAILCPVCSVALTPDDLCATDIELGICHAACLEGSPVVDLDTGEPMDGPAHTYRYSDTAPSSRSHLAASVLSRIASTKLTSEISGELVANDIEGTHDAMILEARAAIIAEHAPQQHVGLTISALQRAHIERQEGWCPDQKPDLSFRGNELGGECGEAQNVIKKLERERHGWRGSRDTIEHLGEELADVIHCAVLCAITAGIDIEQAVIAKFNSTSEKNNLSHRITAPAPMQHLRGAIAAFETAHPKLYWHVAKGKICAGEPLYGAIITDLRGTEIGHGESNESAEAAFAIAVAAAGLAIIEDSDNG